MINNYIQASKDALAQLNKMRDHCFIRLDELKEYGGVSLKNSIVKNNNYYHAKQFGEKAYKYIGGESADSVQLIKEHRYTQQLLQDIEREINAIEGFHSNHISIDFESVNSRLPRAYRRNPGAGNNTVAADASHWKSLMEEEKSKYTVKNSDKLVMAALDGTLVRSKSELVIANMLISEGIPFVYELPRVYEDVTIYTDFTVLSTRDNKTEILIEHEGLMKNGTYQQQFLFKVNKYLAADIIPGKDVFFTFDDLRGGFDTSVVQDIINTRLK